MHNTLRHIERFAERPSLKAHWLLLLLALVLIPHFIFSYRLAQDSMMQDLHTRIVGSRLTEAGRGPYFYEWHKGDDVRLYNPNTSLPHRLNGVTVTPFVLWLHRPLARLNYCDIKLAWWLTEEALLLATFFLTCLIPRSRGRQFITIILAAAFFCYSRNWWQHIYSGQYYVVIAFAFALVAYLSQRNRRVALVILPVAALLRPFFVLTIIPWMLKRLESKMKWVAMGCSLSLLLLFLSGTMKHMPDYLKAMSLYGSEVTGWTDEEKTPVQQAPGAQEECVVKMAMVKTFGAGCLFPVQHYFRLFGLKVNEPLVFSGMLVAGIILFVLLTGYKKITADRKALMLSSFLIYMLCELFTPANRNPYNMIQYLGILGVVMHRATIFQSMLLFAGLVLNHDLPFRFAYQREIGEALMLVVIYLVLRNRKATNTYAATETTE